MSVRTFLALDLATGIRKGLAAVDRQVADPGGKIRWVADHQRHVTLRFLGDLDDAAVAEVCEEAAGAAALVAPFDFQVRGVTCVPPRGRQLRMIWAGVEDPTGRLAELYEKLDAALASLPVKQENRLFRPHVNLARIKYVKDAAGVRAAAAEFAGTDFGTQHAEEVVVYSSRLTPQGPIYTPIAHPKLGA